MNAIVQKMGIELMGLKDLNQSIPFVDERGKDPLENAILKAKAYYRAYQMPVFSCDSGLYFENIEEALQPGTYIRRVAGKELSDDEMIEYYRGLAKGFKGELIGKYRNAISFIYDENLTFNLMDDTITGEPFKLVSTPHQKRVEGFPLDTLSVELESNQYYYDLKENSKQSRLEDGFTCFFQRALLTIKQKIIINKTL